MASRYGAAQSVVHTRVPLRISFGGGGTDVEPYASRYGGITLNATVARYVHCSVWSSDQPQGQVAVTNWNRIARYGMAKEQDRDWALVEAVLGRINPSWQRPLAIHLHSDAPPGSGLGSSSAMVVACIMSLARFMGVVLSAHQVAELAYRVERQDLGVSGGMQDQYATAFGGLNWTTYGTDGIKVRPVHVGTHILQDLELRLVLWHTGQGHLSGGILTHQVEAYRREDSQVLSRLAKMKHLATLMRQALEAGDLDGFAGYLDVSWQEKRGLTDAISTDLIDRLYRMARAAGALGGKVIGAGGGGYLLFYVPEEHRAQVIQALTPVGGSYGGSVYFDLAGPRTWTSESFASEASAFILK